MSFLKSLKGLADDFKEMMSDKDNEKKNDGKPASVPTESNGSSDRNYASGGYQDQRAQQHYNNGQHPYSQSYATQNQYQPQPQYQGNVAPPGPNLPPGWIQQWDPNSQRYYYLEQATGRTQWDPPMNHDRGFGGPPAPSGQNHQYQGGYQPGYDQGYGYGTPAGAVHPGGANYPIEAVKNGEKKKGSNKGALLAAGAGGLALGGLAGAALADDSSDDEQHNSAAPTGYGAPPTAYAAQPGYGAPAADDPLALEHNSDVSSSQRSSLEEARHDYEEAQRKAADSDASSSDHEEAREAREEYEEEIEEARSDAED